jgi:uncharacterized protein YkwD
LPKAECKQADNACLGQQENEIHKGSLAIKLIESVQCFRFTETMPSDSPRLYFDKGLRLAQIDKELLKLEAYMVKRVNEERQAQGLPSLTSHGLLAAIARAHSGEMSDKNYFEHESPTPHLHTPSNRYFLAFHNTPRCVAENIAMGSCNSWFNPEDALEKMVRHRLNLPWRPTQEDIEESHRGLMNSPGHCANILIPDTTIIGIGIVCKNGYYWVTQMFAFP